MSDDAVEIPFKYRERTLHKVAVGETVHATTNALVIDSNGRGWINGDALALYQEGPGAALRLTRLAAGWRVTLIEQFVQLAVFYFDKSDEPLAERAARKEPLLFLPVKEFAVQGDKEKLVGKL